MKDVKKQWRSRRREQSYGAYVQGGGLKTALDADFAGPPEGGAHDRYSGNRRVEADAQHGALRQLDFLAFGRGNRAAAADQDAGQRALEAAEDAADDRADAGAGRRRAAASPLMPSPSIACVTVPRIG